jgi:long-chain acyl-CoA synthetase
MINISGKWPDSILEGSLQTQIDGLDYQIYKNIPSSPYESLCNTANRYPEKIALSEDAQNVTYAEFLKHVNRFANVLVSKYKIHKGNVCALLMVNSIDFCVSFYAINKIGAVAMPLSTKFKSRELDMYLKDSQAEILILDERWFENVRDVLRYTSVKNCLFSGSPKISEYSYLQELSDDVTDDEFETAPTAFADVAVLMYTSGTSGVPKGAYISNLNLMHGIESYRRIFNLTEKDSTIISIPIFHITGLAALLGLFVYIGGTIHLQPFFDPDKTLSCIEKNNLTFIHASPTIYILMLECQSKHLYLPSIKLGACGSANMPTEVVRRLKQWMPQFKMRPVYGLTETSSPATIMPDDPIDIHKEGSSGLPIPGLKMRLVDPVSGELLEGTDAIGELQIKGTVVIKGYSNSQRNLEAFNDGWFLTGDIAKFDDDGFVYIVDRKKDMINHGGEKIYCIQVENVINEFPTVAECAVLGVEDKIYGESVLAVIRLRPGATTIPDELKSFLTGKIAKYEIPRYYKFLDEIPRTDNGKISKRAIYQLLKDEYQQPIVLNYPTL